MSSFSKHLDRKHAVAFLVLLVVFTVWTFLIVDGGLDEGRGHDARVLLTTACTLSGPLVGAIAREFQSCCLRFSLFIMAWCAPALLVGVLAQFVGPRGGKWAAGVRLLLWTVGWLVWFLGGTLSFLHALE